MRAIFTALATTATASAFAATLDGQVQGGGVPIANSTVTLWSASAGSPKQLAQAKTGADGRFAFNAPDAADKGDTLYLVAKGGISAANKAGGDNLAIVLMTALGGKPPATVTINEMTTVASVWTHNQFINGTAIQGQPLQLKIAAGNVPNFVDLASGGWGKAIQDALNSTQSPTMANFATLANVLAGCVTRVKPNACQSLFAAATALDGRVPGDTLAAATSIARAPWHQPQKVFALLDEFYPVPAGKKMPRATPFAPYLTFAPSSWVLPLRFTGGGYYAGGKLMFDSQGNVWAASNFQVGAQAQDYFWQGGVAKFAPDGTPLSPMTTGFTGGGLLGPGFGLAIDAKDNAWMTSFAGNNNVALFGNDGKPLSPPEGWNFGGKLSNMQGIIVTPSGDVWAADTVGSQLVHFPKGDPSKGRVLCQNPGGDPLKNPCKLLLPFAFAIDQKDNIWVTNILGSHVTRFSNGDPTKAETFKTGYSGSGIAVDSLGNVWVTNKLGNSERGRLKMLEMAIAGKVNYDGEPDATSRLTRVMVEAMYTQKPGPEGGSITVLRPDGSEASFSPVYGRGITGPWAVSVDGNDNIWISNFSSATAGIVQLCGFRTENCPPGMKTGDAISPPGGYVGGGLQLQVDIGVGPAGDVWVTNNWQDTASCYGKPDETISTRCGGQGVVVFFGMAKPVRTPLIGPARPQ
ncbi:MAG: hypothetical protein JHC40_00285 [Burkholderiales bacterium]|nr:hypothetical protein [Burkholderiales bacterium]